MDESRIIIPPPNTEVQKMINALEPDGKRPYKTCFNHSEDFFIELDEPFTVRAFPIHHDLDKPEPSSLYLELLKDFLSQIFRLVPDIFSGLVYFFDPNDTLRPAFYRLYEMGGKYFLYILRLEIKPRPLEATIIKAGSNDNIPEYSSRKLFLESEVIPLERKAPGKDGLFIKRIISSTWIGETGRGFRVKGIWMDSHLSKFFTRLFLDEGQRIYPFFPLSCKYETIIANSIILTPSGRALFIKHLLESMAIIEPHIEEIQDSLRVESFSPNNSVFRAIKNSLKPENFGFYRQFRIEAYLNSDERKEYILEIG